MKILVLVSLFFAQAALAVVPDEYNAVRCRRSNETSTAVHVGMHNNVPTGMFWIENDRVTVLSNDLTHDGSIVTGVAVGGEEIYTLDYQNQIFTVTDASGKVLRKESNLLCSMCRIDQPYCPGDEPGKGTNIPHP